MPTYNFICNVCGAAFEQNRRFDEHSSSATCPNGHVQVRRVFSAPAIGFKGSGFYITDSRPKQNNSSVDN